MAEVVELVPKTAIDKLREPGKKKSGCFRLVAVRNKQQEVQKETIAEAPIPPADAPEFEDNSTQATDTGAERLTEKILAATPNVTADEPTPRQPAGANSARTGSDYFDLFEVGQGCLAIVWKLEKVDNWSAPFLGAVCKEILGKKRIRKVVFDFAGVQEISTTAVSTLVRFKNTIVHLDKTMYVVAGLELRRQLANSHVDRMIEVVDSVSRVIGTEVKFQEKPVARDRKKSWWRLFSLLLIVVVQTANVAGEKGAPQGGFPTLAELERLIPEAPELQTILLEIETLRLGTSWTRHVNFHTSYSQHFASYVPVLSPSERKISGDTLVFGVSASIALDELVQGRKKASLELRLKQLEYQQVFQAKLASLRVLYNSVDRLAEHLTALEAQVKTAGLKLERVRAGLQFEFLGFTPIDLAEAEEAVTRLEVERRQTSIEVMSIEIRILEVIGKGESAP